MACTVKDIDPNEIYFRDVRTNAQTGAKTVLISRHPTSNSPEHNLQLQLSPESAWFSHEHLCRAKFGVDEPRVDPMTGQVQGDKYKRTIQLTAEDPRLVPFVQALEEQVVKMAVERSVELWGQKKTEEIVRDQLKSLLKPPPPEKQDEMSSLIKCKIVLHNPAKRDDEQRNVTKVFTAENVVAPCAEFPSGKLDLVPVSDPVRTITKGTECLAKVRASAVWKSPAGIGITFALTHMIVWPAAGPNGSIESAFAFGGASVSMGDAGRDAAPVYDEDMDCM